MDSNSKPSASDENSLLLEELSKKFVKSGYKLPKHEVQEVSRILCDLLPAQDEAANNSSLQFIGELPPESFAEALKSSWPRLQEDRRVKVNEALQQVNVTRGWRLRSAVAVALRDVDGAAARRFLMDVCRTMVDKVHNRPRKEAISVFRNCLLRGQPAPILGFNLANSIQAEVGPFLACLSVGGFGERDQGIPSIDTQRHLFEWMAQHRLLERLTAPQRELIGTAVQSWPPPQTAQFSQLLAEFKISIPTGGHLVHPTQIGEAGKAPTPVVEVASAKELRAKDLLVQLSRALQRLEDENASVNEALNELREKRLVADREKQALHGEIAAMRAKLSEAEDEASTLRLMTKRLEDDNSDLDTKLTVHVEKIRSITEAHKVESKRLIDRIEVESERAVEAFKNNVTEELKRYRRSYDDVGTEPMSEKLGEALRRHLQEIFAALEREGIQTKR